MAKDTDDRIIVLFDGVCNLCSGTVQFIIRNDPAGIFRFAALQSDQGRYILASHGIPEARNDSVLVIADGKVHDRSDAALRIAANLSGPWNAFRYLKFIPRFLRNAVYDMISRSRYRVFGKKDQCMIPTPELRDRFL